MMPTMKGKRNTALIITALAGAAYLASKVLKKKCDHHLAQAIVSMKDGDYSAAVEYLSQIPVKNNEVLLLLSDCHDKLHNVTDAVAYLNMCIRNIRGKETILGIIQDITLRLMSGGTAYNHGDLKKLVEKRFAIYSENGMSMEAFKDAFLLSIMADDTKYKNISTEYLKVCTLERSRNYCITGWASNINFEDFFQTLFFLENVKDPSAVFLASGEYEKCYEYVSDGNTEFHRFLKGCFLYVNGDVAGAASIFIGETYLYSKMMFIFIKVTARPNFKPLPVLEGTVEDKGGMEKGHKETALSETNDKSNSSTEGNDGSSSKSTTENTTKTKAKNFTKNNKKYRELAIKRLNKYELNIFEHLLDNEDLTVQLYVAKMFEGLKMVDMQLQSIDRCLTNRRTAPGMGQKIIIYIRQDRQQSAVKLITEAVTTFPDSINLHCIAIEYFLHIGDYQRGAELLQQIECFYRKDPRIFIFKYLLSKAGGNPDVGYLREGISIDPKYFKTYIYLGNHLMGDEESLQIYQDALACARTFDELFTVFQVLTVVETEQELTSEYPKLFVK
ncbi:hypothetical protein PAEPH01_1054 [Pancytospora epiphaga]|nr:hypothetical protein PAEPH01_1054 [Pancytospora epiphaga]